MQHISKIGAFLSLTLLSAAASADVVTLTFEGATGNVNSFYAGGTDGSGKTGPNVGVTVTNGAAVVSNKGGNAYGPPIANDPSPNTVFWIRDPQIVFNKPGGFTSGFSLMYTSMESSTGTVNVYSGLNGIGSLLATFTLPGHAQCPNVPLSYYCNWSSVGATFTGPAQSVTISSSDPLRTWLENVTFGSVSPLTFSGNTPSALVR